MQLRRQRKLQPIGGCRIASSSHAQFVAAARTHKTSCCNIHVYVHVHALDANFLMHNITFHMRRACVRYVRALTQAPCRSYMCTCRRTPCPSVMHPISCSSFHTRVAIAIGVASGDGSSIRHRQVAGGSSRGGVGPSSSFQDQH